MALRNPGGPVVDAADSAGPNNVEFRLTQQYRADPAAFQMPEGYELKGDSVIRIQNPIMRHPWLIAPMALGAGFGAQALVGLAGAPAAASPLASTSTVGASALPAGGTGLTAGAYGAAETGLGASALAAPTAASAGAGSASLAGMGIAEGAAPTAASAGAGSASLAGMGITEGAAPGASAVTSGASTVLPSSPVYGTGMGMLPAGGQGLAAGATSGGGGILSTINRGAGIAQTLNPVLGKAAEGLANNQNTAFNQAIAQQNAAQLQRRTALSNTARANLLRADPVHTEQGPEGSGFGGRSPSLHYAGGAATPFDDATKQAMQPFIDQQIQELLHPPALTDPNTQPGKSSTGSKILGGLATAAGLYGALRR